MFGKNKKNGEPGQEEMPPPEEDDRDISELSEEEKDELIQEMAKQMYMQHEVIGRQKQLIDHYHNKLQQVIKEKESSKIDIIISAEETTYGDVGGLDQVIAEIKHFEYGLKYPKVYGAYGIESPNGLLMYGPPGCGKTMIAKAMSNELDCWFMEIPLSQVISKYVGEAERNLEEAIESAKERYQETNRKVMIFVDEAEQMFRRKGLYTDGPQVVERCVNIWLRTMDGMGSNDGLIFVAATNHLNQIDEAMRRAGRFDYIVEIPKPDRDAVQDIFIKQIRMMERKAGREIYQVENVPQIADRMYDIGVSGADIAEILKKASLSRIKNFVERFEVSGERKFGSDEYIIRDDDIENVLREYDRVEEEKVIGFGV